MSLIHYKAHENNIERVGKERALYFAKKKRIELQKSRKSIKISNDDFGGYREKLENYLKNHSEIRYVVKRKNSYVFDSAEIREDVFIDVFLLQKQ